MPESNALEISELRYRRLFEAAYDGILLLNADTKKIMDANPFMSTLLDYTHDEFLGKELWEIGLLKDKKASQDAFAILEKEGFIRYENLPLESKNGQKKEVEFVSNVYQEGKTSVIQCNIREITERKKMERLLAEAAQKNEKIAKALQDALLLQPPPSLFPGFDVELFYEAASEEALIGGDFFDAFTMHDKYAFIVGDVAGKGLAAATHTAEIKYALRAMLYDNPNPGEVLEKLNNFYWSSQKEKRQQNETFIVISVLVLDPVTGRGWFSKAGSEPPLHIDTHGRQRSLGTGGMPLGVQADEKFEQMSVEIAPGDMIALFTDGITEAKRKNVLFGYSNLKKTLREHSSSKNVKHYGQCIIETIRTWAEGKFNDDVCLILVRRNKH